MYSYYKILLIGIVIILSYSNICAGTFYVDQNHPQASNANPGTEDLPWATMQKGAAAIAGGDTLYVKEGIYEGSFTFTGLAGTSDNPTVIISYPGHQAVFQGPGFDGGRVKIANCSWMEFRDFEITNFNQGLFIEGESEHITIENIAVYNIGQEGVHVKENSSHILFNNCRVYNTGLWRYNGEGFYIGTGSAGPLDNSSYITIRNSVIYNTTDEAIEFKPGTHNCIADGNIIYNTRSDRMWGAIEVNQSISGVQEWHDNPNHIVRNNIIHNINGTAIRAGTGCLIYNNVIYGIDHPNYGIYVNNINNDRFTRYIYHNTVNLSPSRAIFVHAGPVEIKNNIGSSLHGNMIANENYFVSVESGKEDFRLVAGAPPINAGVDVGIDKDINGVERPQGLGYDMGAYEYVAYTGIEENLPYYYSLSQNYPNPFNPSTTISYSLLAGGNVSLIVYDILGREVTTLVSETKQAGSHTVQWNGTDSAGLPVGSGVYFYRLHTNDGVSDIKKMILLR